DRAGVVIGTGIGGITTFEEQHTALMERGARRVSPFLVPMMMGNRGAADVSMRYGFRGPCEATVTACAAGTHSVANGARLVATGRCDVVLAGSAEAAMTPLSLAGFANMTALSTSGISRPFDARRDGFVMGEGGAVLVLEDMDRAIARGAHVYAELAGAASNADAYHITAPSPEGAGAVACMDQALADADLSPERVTHVNAHGTSTPKNDAAVAEAMAKVFGAPGPAVTSIKGITGHSLGAAGSLEAVALALTFEHRLIPPTVGWEVPDPEIHLDLVTGEAREWEPGPALSNSFGFGGHNGTLVMVPAPARAGGRGGGAAGRWRGAGGRKVGGRWGGGGRAWASSGPHDVAQRSDERRGGDDHERGHQHQGRTRSPVQGDVQVLDDGVGHGAVEDERRQERPAEQAGERRERGGDERPRQHYRKRGDDQSEGHAAARHAGGVVGEGGGAENDEHGGDHATQAQAAARREDREPGGEPGDGDGDDGGEAEQHPPRRSMVGDGVDERLRAAVHEPQARAGQGAPRAGQPGQVAERHGDAGGNPEHDPEPPSHRRGCCQTAPVVSEHPKLFQLAHCRSGHCHSVH
ncbi:MAG: beta-ketoacyl-[acyl-carrier-protein] synthase family protein, partial [Acidimicrobiales bacterium]